MSDWQQPGPTPPPPPPQQYGYQPGYPQQPYGAPAPQPVAPQPKKKTGLIIAVVVGALLLTCCCGAAVAGFIAYQANQSTSSTTGTTTETTATNPEPPASEMNDPTAAARSAEWAKVTAAYVKSADAQYAAPDDRQLDLARKILAQLLPDFELDELMVDPGYVDDDGTFIFDGYNVKVHLREDPRVVTAYGFDVGTREADAARLTADGVDTDDGEGKMQIAGTTWVIFPNQSKVPLLNGIKDHSYVDLLLLASEQWPGALPTEVLPQADGSVLLRLESWDSYNYSDTYDRIEATYARDGDGWKLGEFKAVIEPKDQPGTSGEGVEI